jgi:predicted nucleic acid-binding protein
LTLAECLIGARKARSRALEELYENLLAPSGTIMPVPISRDILRAAALFAGEANVKLADAIHVATAIALDCDVFLTNDRRVIAPNSIRLMQLGDVKRA